MERCCVLAGAEDTAVCLLFGARGDARGDEGGGEVLFVFGGWKGAEHGCVCAGRDGVGVPEEGNLVGVFGDAAFVDGSVQEGVICGDGCYDCGELRSRHLGFEV